LPAFCCEPSICEWRFASHGVEQEISEAWSHKLQVDAQQGKS